MITTKQKIFLAKVAKHVVFAWRRLFQKGSTTVATRKGLCWSLDLNEGIDFAIYLLGGFELETRKAFAEIIKSGMTVVDIGANVGAHTLPLVDMVGDHG